MSTGEPPTAHCWKHLSSRCKGTAGCLCAECVVPEINYCSRSRTWRDLGLQICLWVSLCLSRFPIRNYFFLIWAYTVCLLVWSAHTETEISKELVSYLSEKRLWHEIQANTGLSWWAPKSRLLHKVFPLSSLTDLFLFLAPVSFTVAQ